LSFVAVNFYGYEVGSEVFAPVDFVEPYGSCGSMQFPLDVLVGECFFCLFGTCKFYARVTMHL
jgi:hypothetical protein